MDTHLTESSISISYNSDLSGDAILSSNTIPYDELKEFIISKEWERKEGEIYTLIDQLDRNIRSFTALNQCLDMLKSALDD